MSEEEKPCIQDRLRSAAMRSKEIFASWPVISLILIILFFIVALPEILTHLIGRKVLIPILSVISLESRFEILFGLSVAIFSSLQYISARNRNRIEDAKNELENAYGPLYTILNRSKYGEVGKIILEIMELDKFDKNELDEILSTYPFMFPDKIFEYWRNNIQGKNIDLTHYNIPVEFRDMINKEYDIRRRRYDKLLGK